MGSVYKETYTKPLPARAELFTRGGQQWARWTDRRGQKRTARVTVPKKGKNAGRMRIVLECSTHVAKYRDGRGLLQKRGTGCRNKDTAASFLDDLRARAELVKAKLLTPAQDAAADHAARPIAGHVDAYDSHLQAKGTTDQHRKDTLARIRRLVADCRFGYLADLAAGPLEKWLLQQGTLGMGASTRNAYLESMVAFCRWCIADDRLTANPFIRVPKADEKADRRRSRRAMTEEELRRLLTVAQLRPLADYGRPTVATKPDEDNPKRANWRREDLTFETIEQAAGAARGLLKERPDFVADLERRGREHALIYKALVLTGLRRGELGSITVGQLELDGPTPHLVLHAADEKNRQGSDIPLRADLVEDLRAWLAGKLAQLQAAARLRLGEAVPMRLPADAPLFDVPAGLGKILDRDLVAAGLARRVRDPKTGRASIDKRDERGRTIDVHALRHTFGTHLSKGGVPLRTAQAAMRHSTPALTANVYTDPKLLDVAGALDALPVLPLDGELQAQRQVATGTAGEASAGTTGRQAPARTLVPRLVPTSGRGCPSRAATGQTDPVEHGDAGEGEWPETDGSGHSSTELAAAGRGCQNRGNTIRTCDLLDPNQ